MPKRFFKEQPTSSTKYSHLEEPGGDVLDADVAVTQPLTDSIIDTNETETALSKLRRVPDSLPASVWIIIVIETCERIAYFGIAGPLQNYIQNPSDDPLRPGGLGLGQANASRINQSFLLWCYLTPIFGAIIADQYLGRVSTIIYSSVVYMIGLALLATSSLFVVSFYPVSVGGLALAMAFIGVGTGGIKANVGSLLAEQYTGTKETIVTTEEGEKIIVDPKVTIQRIFMMFYVYLNIGSMSGLITTNVEHSYGFSTAFIMPLFAFFLGFGILLVTKKNYVTQAPKGSAIPDAFKVLWIGILHGFDLEAAKPSYQTTHGKPKLTILWDDLFVDEVRRALVACRAFLFLPFYFVCYIQLQTNFVSQAATMETHGIPNDIMTNINPVVVIIFTPILDRVVYPFLRKIGVNFWPITRIAAAFIILSSAMAYAAIVQHIIYTSPPCFDHPRSRDCMGGTVPNQVHIALQAPVYVLIALSEIFAITTGYEYAFTKAPSSMKSFVPALFMSTAAVGNFLGITITPLTVDPKIIWMYTGLAVQSFLTGVAFYLLLRRYNKVEVELGVRDAGEHDPIDAALSTADEEHQSILHTPSANREI